MTVDKKNTFEELPDIPENASGQEQLNSEDNHGAQDNGAPEKENFSRENSSGPVPIEDDYPGEKTAAERDEADVSDNDNLESESDAELDEITAKIIETDTKGERKGPRNETVSRTADFFEEISRIMPEGFDLGSIGRINLKEAEDIASEDVLAFKEKEFLEELDDIDLSFLEDDTDGEIDEILTGRGQIQVPAAGDQVLGREQDALHRPVDAKKETQGPVKEEVPEEGETVPEEKTVAEPSAHDEADQTSGEAAPAADARVFPSVTPAAHHEHRETKTADEDTGYQAFDPGKTEVHTEDGGKEVPAPGAVTEQPEHAGEETIPPEGAGIGGPEAVEKREVLPEYMRSVETEDDVSFIDDVFVEKPDDTTEAIFEDSRLDTFASDFTEAYDNRGVLLTEIETAGDEYIVDVDRDISAVAGDFFLEFEEDYKYSDEDIDYIHASIIEEDYNRYLREIDEFYGYEDKKRVSQAVELFGLTENEINNFQDRLFEDEYRDVDLYEIFDFFTPEFEKRDTAAEDYERTYNYLLSDTNSFLEWERTSIETDITTDNALIYEEDVNEIKDLWQRAPGVNESVLQKIMEGVESRPAEYYDERAVDDVVPETITDEFEEPDETEIINLSENRVPDKTVSRMPDEAGAEGPDEIDVYESTAENFEVEIGILDEMVEEAPEAGKVAQEGMMHEDINEAELDPVEVAYDITDNVILIEDDLDIDRFVKEFPKEKQGDLKKLFKYLDGLFEKLPENTIKKFADSEYFDLYAKVINDLGV